MEDRTQVREIHIPARTAVAFDVEPGMLFALVDLEGKQVADMIAYCRDSDPEWFSPSYTCSCLAKMVPQTGDALYSNLRNPLLTILEDRVGTHDFVVPCCDSRRYEFSYGLTDHPSCQSSLLKALKEYGREVDPVHLPPAGNIFMNNVVLPDGRIETREPVSRPGDLILFQVHRPLLVAISACPQDLTPCNAFNPTDMAVRIYA